MKKAITISVLSNEKTGLLVALSANIPGLMVHGYTYEEIDGKLPGAVREMIEAGAVVADHPAGWELVRASVLTL